MNQRRHIGRACALTILVCLVSATGTPSAQAEPERRCYPNGRCVVVSSGVQDTDEPEPSEPVVRPSSKKRAITQIQREANEQWQRSADKKLAAYRRAIDAQSSCIQNYKESLGQLGNLCRAPLRPELGSPYQVGYPGMANPAGPTLRAEDVAYLAVATLQLPKTKPDIGPPPSINQWKMAAVGYPLWLSADGPRHVGPVATSVFNLSVSLEARLTETTYRMGDGHQVRCRGGGTAWTRAVKPGSPSPTCGYRYTKPSLPRGNYTVTATSSWAVTWRANGETGIITVPLSGTSELPVGELQVLVR